jgi:glycosyltransferase involved in cell wall biosynthesis
MQLLFLEPFYGGSHKDFADGLCRFLPWPVDLYTLPGRSWKWRMRGAALHFSQKLKGGKAYDALITSSMMSLADFKALAGTACPPSIVYFHENQLTYPGALDKSRDHHFAFTNLTTAVTAKRVLFNSETHRLAFLESLTGFLRRMPDFRPLWAIDSIESKTHVCHPGCHFPPGAPGAGIKELPLRPLVIWNHRWEFDKQPWIFFSVMEKLAAEGVDFDIAVLGESFAKAPQCFKEAKKTLKGRIRRWGYAEGKEVYLQWLAQGAVVVGTAAQENFGISIIEAVRQGCLPLVPNRLVYPEIIPAFAHSTCLYDHTADLAARLARVLSRPDAYIDLRRRLSQAMEKYSWENRIGCFEKHIKELTEAPAV